MAKPDKRTKKFQKSKLANEISRRKDFQKKKRRFDKRKRNGAAENESGEEYDDQEQQEIKRPKLGANAAKSGDSKLQLDDMNVDQFMEKGFFDAMEAESGEEDAELEDLPEEEEVTPKKQQKKDTNKKQKDNNKKNKKQTQDDEDEDDDVEMSDTEMHAHELEQLAEIDPEFYEFMKKEEGALLDFGKAEIAAKKVEREIEAADTRAAITKELVNNWAQQFVQNGSLKSLKHLVDAFRIACHLNDADEQEAQAAMSMKFRIVSSGAFNYVMMFSLKQLLPIVERHLKKDMKEELTGSRFAVTKSPRWSKMRPFIKAYFAHLLHFLLELAEPKMLAFVLQQSQKMLRFLAPFPNFTKRYLKKFLELWSTSSAETVRILAFLNIRQMALDIPFPFIENCLKGVYLTYVRNSKFYNAKSQPIITFMTNCVVEMYGLDFVASYQHAFVYIRQLAIHLHGAANSKNKDAIQNVYNWQTLNSINAWVRVLAAYPKQENLQHLLYPLAQLIEGIIALQPAPKYFPLRLHCVQMLNLLAERSGVYVNSGSYLQEVFAFEQQNLGTKFEVSSEKAFDPRFQLKVPKKAMGSKAHQDAIFHWANELLLQWLAFNSNSIAFPELSLPMALTLKKFIKVCKISYMRRAIQSVVEKINLNNKYIEAKRSNVLFSSKDVKQTHNFLASDEERLATPMSRAYADYMKTKPETLEKMGANELTMEDLGPDDEESDEDEDDLDEMDVDENGDLITDLGDDFDDLEGSDEEADGENSD